MSTLRGLSRLTMRHPLPADNEFAGISRITHVLCLLFAKSTGANQVALAVIQRSRPAPVHHGQQGLAQLLPQITVFQRRHPGALFVIRGAGVPAFDVFKIQYRVLLLEHTGHHLTGMTRMYPVIAG